MFIFSLKIVFLSCSYTLLLFKRCGKSCCKESRVDTVKMVNECPQDAQFHIQFERNKPSLGDFTIDEYMEKVIQYGYLMVSSRCFISYPITFLLNTQSVHRQSVSNKRSVQWWKIIFLFLRTWREVHYISDLFNQKRRVWLLGNKDFATFWRREKGPVIQLITNCSHNLFRSNRLWSDAVS